MMYNKGNSPVGDWDELEEDPEDIRQLYEIVLEGPPECDEGQLYRIYLDRTGWARETV